jgi:hypothetical protein
MLIETGIVINGVDISPWILLKGVKWARKDVEGGNGGLTLDGTTVRDVLASKVSLEISCIPLELLQLRELQILLLPTSFEVTYDDPIYGEVTKTMCCKEGKASIHTIRQGRELWEGVVFKLEEL